MIVDFIIGIMLLGSLFHFSMAIWNVRVISPFGMSKKANIAYGVLISFITISLYLYKNGLQKMLNDYIYLGGLFAIVYTVLLGLWINRTKPLSK